MSCGLTTGYTLGCRDAAGGIKEVRIAVLNATGTVATNGSGTVTGFTGYGTSFYEYDLTKATSQMTETANVSLENGTVFYQQDVQFIINKLQVAVRNELRLLARNRVLAIVRDQNDRYWLLGAANGCDMSAGTAQTGTAFGDRSGYDITLTGMETEPMYLVSGTLLSGITNTSQISGS